MSTLAETLACIDAMRDDPEAPEISVDTKAKVGLGAYARGGKNPDRRRR